MALLLTGGLTALAIVALVVGGIGTALVALAGVAPGLLVALLLAVVIGTAGVLHERASRKTDRDRTALQGPRHHARA